MSMGLAEVGVGVCPGLDPGLCCPWLANMKCEGGWNRADKCGGGGRFILPVGDPDCGYKLE